MASEPNVLPLFDPPVRKNYRTAVRQCVDNARKVSGLSWDDLAEKLGCSKDTLTNAFTEEHDLSGVTLLRIGYVYGEDAIAPALDLVRRRYCEPPTKAERYRRLHAELDALEKGA